MAPCSWVSSTASRRASSSRTTSCSPMACSGRWRSRAPRTTMPGWRRGACSKMPPLYVRGQGRSRGKNPHGHPKHPGPLQGPVPRAGCPGTLPSGSWSRQRVTSAASSPNTLELITVDISHALLNLSILEADRGFAVGQNKCEADQGSPAVRHADKHRASP